jgi:hypothetical protein
MQRWAVIFPVAGWNSSKSRLVGEVQTMFKISSVIHSGGKYLMLKISYAQKSGKICINN